VPSMPSIRICKSKKGEEGGCQSIKAGGGETVVVLQLIASSNVVRRVSKRGCFAVSCKLCMGSRHCWINFVV
jgi:hypothetical protein